MTERTQRTRSVKSVLAAAGRGDVGLLRRVFSEGTEGLGEPIPAIGDVRDAQGETVLHRAAKAGQLEALEWLLDQPGVDCNIRDTNYKSPLMLAAAEGNANCVSCLLSRGALVHAWKPNAWDALMYAAAHGHTECVRLLLDAGAPVDHCTHEGATSLYVACRGGWVDTCLELLARGAPPSMPTATGRTPAHAAVMESHPAVLSALLSHGADCNAVDGTGKTLLHMAGMHGSDADMVQQLLSPMDEAHRIAVDSLQRTAVHLAAVAGHAETVDALLSSPLCGTTLLEQRDAHGCTALYLAAVKGHERVVECLLSYGADPETATDRRTALHCACLWGHRAVADRLAQAGASWDAVDAEGRSARDIAREVWQTGGGEDS